MRETNWTPALWTHFILPLQDSFRGIWWLLLNTTTLATLASAFCKYLCHPNRMFESSWTTLILELKRILEKSVAYSKVLSWLVAGGKPGYFPTKPSSSCPSLLWNWVKLLLNFCNLNSSHACTLVPFFENPVLIRGVCPCRPLLPVSAETISSAFDGPTDGTCLQRVPAVLLAACPLSSSAYLFFLLAS